MTTKAKNHWYYKKVLMHYLQRDFDSGLDISFKYIQFMRKNMHLFSANKILPILSNFIYHAALTKAYKSFETGIKYLQEISSDSSVTLHYYNYILYTRSLEFAYYTNDLKLTEEYLIQTIDLLKTNKVNFEDSQIQYLYMVIVRASIVLQKYNEGTVLINQWFQHGVLSYKKVQARLFSLIIHYELGYWDLISSEIAVLKKLEKTYLRESSLINAFYSFFNQILKHPELKERIIIALQDNLESIANDNPNYFEFISFDYYRWSIGSK